MGWELLRGQLGNLAAMGAPRDPPVPTFIENGTLSASSTTFTKTGAAFGSADANRRVIVAFGGAVVDAGRTLVSATIGGVAATVHIQKNQNDTSWSGEISAVVPTGTTGDIVLTMADSVFSPNYYSLWTADNSLFNSTTPNTGSGGVTGDVSVTTGSVTSLADGFIIAVTGFGNGGSKVTNTVTDTASDTFTIDVVTPSANGQLMAASASAIAGGSITVTSGWTGSFDAAICATAWR